MRIKRKGQILVWSLLLVCGVSARAEQALFMHMTDGTRITYLLADEPKIGFSGQTITVAVAGDTRNVPMENVQRWTVGTAEAGVQTPSADNMQLFVMPGAVRILSACNVEASLCSLTGMTADSASGSDITLTAPAGIYIVKVGSKAYKVAL